MALNTEVPWKPPFELWKTDHGVDGWDSRTWLVAKFTTEQKAKDYLKAKGYTYYQYGGYYHEDIKLRHTMGALSYTIKNAPVDVPLDPMV